MAVLLHLMLPLTMTMVFWSVTPSVTEAMLEPGGKIDTKLMNCKDLKVVSIWNEFLLSRKQTVAEKDIVAKIQLDQSFDREEDNSTSEMLKYQIQLTLSTATGNSTPTKISKLIATVLPDSNCDASGQFRVYTEKDLVAHCIHQNDTIVYEQHHSTPKLSIFIKSTRNPSCINIGFGIMDHLDQFYYSKQGLKLEQIDVDINFTENVHEVYQNVIEKRFRRAVSEQATISNAYLIFGQYKYLYQLSLDGSRFRAFYSNLQNQPIKIDYHYRLGQIFWIERYSNIIRRSYFNGSNMAHIVIDEPSFIVGLAVDWISDKLYWIGIDWNQYTLSVNVHDLKINNHTEIISLNTPYYWIYRYGLPMVIDPFKRRIYWANIDEGYLQTSIEMASMDGRNRSVVHDTNSSQITSLTIDYQRQVLYWVNAGIIECSDVDGSNRRTVYIDGVGYAYGLAIFDDTLFLTDTYYDEFHSIKMVDVNGGNATGIFRRSSCISPRHIAIVSDQKQPTLFNPCSANYGGCSHLCLLSAVDPRNYSCDCPSGMILIDDLTCMENNTLIGPTQLPLQLPTSGSCLAAGYSSGCCMNDSCQGSPSTCYCDFNCHLFQDCCIDVSPTCTSQDFTDFDNYLLYYTRDNFVDLLDLRYLSPLRLQIIHSGLNITTDVDYLISQGYMFWSDYNPNYNESIIWRSNFDGSQTIPVIIRQESGPTYFAVDWVSLKIYLAVSNKGVIEVFDLVTSYHTCLVALESGVQPRSIVLDPNTRYLYWIDILINGSSMIERASMDGTGRTVIHTSNFTLMDIALDHVTQTLYWGYNNYRQIESSDADGSNRRVLASSTLPPVWSIDFFGGNIFIAYYRSVMSISVIMPNATRIRYNNIIQCNNLKDIKVVSPARQLPALNPCGNNNGGCTHLCLLSSTDPRGYSCACHNGTVLHQDLLQCIGEATTMTPYQQPGSCAAAGYQSCCTSGNCQGEPNNCYCDKLCTLFRDCCFDAVIICNSVTSQLQFVTEPVNQMTVEGETVQFHCSVQSGFLVTFVWEFTRKGSRDSQVIADSNGPVVSDKYSLFNFGQTTSRLSVYSAELSDAGSYTCSVSTSTGQNIHADAQLEILFSPRDVTVEISGSTTLPELATAVLTCQFLANPKPTIRWLKRETDSLRVLTNTSRISVSTFQEETYSHRSMMVIERARATDSGEYLCEVENILSTLPIVSNIMVTVNAMNECRTDNGNSPCKNGGVCTDLVKAYLCTCSGGFQGTNCDMPLTAGDTTPPDIRQPPENVTTALVSSVNLTCTAEGHPAPTYKWYKDGVLIPGEHLPFLYIPEVLPADRGSYTCKAINNRGETESLSASLDVPGLYQYSTLLKVPNGTNDTDEILLLIASSNLSQSSAFVHSVKILSDSQSESNEVEILITVIRRNDSEMNDQVPIRLVEGLRRNLYSQLLAIQNILVIDVSRYDGCNPDTFKGSEWPETNLGSSASVPCPCSEFAGSLAGKIFRFCEGTYSQKARWSDHLDKSQCTALNSQQTGLLCEAAQNASSATVAVSTLVAEVTSEPENLEAADISVSISIIDQLTDEAVTNVEVRDNYLEIIDNIQQADRETVLTSQNATNSTSRLLNSIGDFLDLVTLNENKTDGKTVFGYETYALQIQKLDPLEFNGQTFTVDLGSVADTMNITQIKENELITSEIVMSAISNATASVSISRDLINGQDNCQSESSNSSQQRLSYSVFLSDILFQSLNQSQFKVGSIILSARLNCLANDSEFLSSPIQTTFRTHSQISDDISDSVCAHWDSNRFGAWSTDGCMKINSNGDSVSCECRQLAHFGVLFDLSPRFRSDEAVLVLSVFSYIGLVTSLLCLCIFLFTYLWVKKLRLSIHGQILINLCLSLMGLYVFFLISGHVTSVPVLCGISSALLQYFLLVFFGWTAVEAVWLYLNLVKVFGIQSYTAKYTLKAAIPTWVVPMLIVILSAGPGYKYYTNSFYCRATEWPFWFGTIVPFLVTYIFNWIMFIAIMVSIFKHTRSTLSKSKSDKNKPMLQSTKKNCTAALTLAIVFGLGWAFGLTATSLPVEELTLTFQIIFCLLVGAQGVLIFLLHGVRNKDFRSFWIQMLHLVARNTRLSYVFTSTKSTAASESTQHNTGATTFATLDREKSNTKSSVGCSLADEKSCFDETKFNEDDEKQPERYASFDQIKA